jgi:hypothetical protein
MSDKKPKSDSEPGFLSHAWKWYRDVYSQKVSFVSPNDFGYLGPNKPIREPSTSAAYDVALEGFSSTTVWRISPQQFFGLNQYFNEIRKISGSQQAYPAYLVESDYPNMCYSPGTKSFYISTTFYEAFKRDMESFISHEYGHAIQDEKGLGKTKSPEWLECDGDRRSAQWMGEEKFIQGEKDLYTYRNNQPKGGIYPPEYTMLPDHKHGDEVMRIARVSHHLACPGEPGGDSIPQSMLDEAQKFLDTPEPQSGVNQHSTTLSPKKHGR